MTWYLLVICHLFIKFWTKNSVSYSTWLLDILKSNCNSYSNSISLGISIIRLNFLPFLLEEPLMLKVNYSCCASHLGSSIKNLANYFWYDLDFVRTYQFLGGYIESEKNLQFNCWTSLLINHKYYRITSLLLFGLSYLCFLHFSSKGVASKDWA